MTDDQPIAVDPGDIAELDRRWNEIARGGVTVANAEVVRWLRAWGTPSFRPWQDNEPADRS